MEWGRRACHWRRITPIPHSLWPMLAGHFPNLAPTFYAASPHNFLPGSTKLHMLSCNSTYFRWVGRICREIKPTGLRSSSFQSLVVESERLSFPTTGNWQTMEKQAAMNWQYQATMPGNELALCACLPQYVVCVCLLAVVKTFLKSRWGTLY